MCTEQTLGGPPNTDANGSSDGADLLEMSLTYNVHISLTTHPLALRVEGFRGSLKRLTEHIESVKQVCTTSDAFVTYAHCFAQSIVHETYQLPTKVRIPQDIVQQISRLAGAFLENMKPDGMVRRAGLVTPSLT